MNKELIKNLEQIAGDDSVETSQGVCVSYAEDRSFTRGFSPAAVVSPTDDKQIEELVRYAKAEGLPLVPVSSTGEHYRGDTVPARPDSIIVDLSKKNKILNISRQQRIAVIEPGVTYPQLQAALAEEGMTISSSFAPRRGKSVIGSLLEIEPRMNCIHQWNYSEPLRCLGVTWGDGNTIFTGEAGRGPKDLPQQWDSQKWQVTQAGPNMIDFARLLTTAQGTMGIVSWASVKCEVKPTEHKSFFIESNDLHTLIDFNYDVIRPRFSDELFIINRTALESITGVDASKTGEWICFCGIAGRPPLPQMRMQQQELDVRDIATKNGLTMKESLAGVDAEEFYQSVNGTCGGPYAKAWESNWKDNRTGAHQEIPFVTTMDQAVRFNELIETLLKKEHAGEAVQAHSIYIQPQHCGTSAHMEFDFHYKGDDDYACEQMRRFLRKAQERLNEAGAYFSRPYGHLAKLQLNKDARTYNAQKRIRKIFDPAGIMNPGKMEL